MGSDEFIDFVLDDNNLINKENDDNKEEKKEISEENDTEENSDISLVFEYCDFNLYELIKTYKRKQMSISESKIKNIIYNTIYYIIFIFIISNT